MTKAKINNTKVKLRTSADRAKQFESMRNAEKKVISSYTMKDLRNERAQVAKGVVRDTVLNMGLYAASTATIGFAAPMVGATTGVMAGYGITALGGRRQTLGSRKTEVRLKDKNMALDMMPRKKGLTGRDIKFLGENAKRMKANIERTNALRAEKEAAANKISTPKSEVKDQKPITSNSSQDKERNIAEKSHKLWSDSVNNIQARYNKVKDNPKVSEKKKKELRDGVAELKIYERASRANLDYHSGKSSKSYDTHRNEVKRDIDRIKKEYNYDIDDKKIDEILDREMRK